MRFFEALSDSDEVEELVERVRRATVMRLPCRCYFRLSTLSIEDKTFQVASHTWRAAFHLSHQILPEYREYERTSTVVVNAYLQPLMGRYLRRLAESEESPWFISSNPKTQSTKDQRSAFVLRVMQSSGGSISAEAAAHEPVRTILSGRPAAVVGALLRGQASRL